MTRFYWLTVALALILPVPSPASAAGLPVAKKIIVIKNKDIKVSVEYPQTGNKAIDAVLRDDAVQPAEKVTLRQSQRAWIALRDMSCVTGASGEYLTKLYRDRLAALGRR